MKKTAVFLLTLILCPLAFAHMPVCRCEMQDQTIECEGAYDDGSAAKGVSMRVQTYAGATLHSGALDQNSRFRAQLPDQPFYILMDAGPGEMFEVDWRDIEGLSERLFQMATTQP